MRIIWNTEYIAWTKIQVTLMFMCVVYIISVVLSKIKSKQYFQTNLVLENEVK
jgi:hypothetical protein